MTTIARPGSRLSARTSAATSRITVVGLHAPASSVVDATYFGSALSAAAISSSGLVTVGQ
jgi:hypothetical protein